MRDGAVIRAGTNGMAVASLVLSILSFGGVGSLLALVFGSKARKQIDALHEPRADSVERLKRRNLA